MEIRNKKILITGGGSGIGYGLAERFLKDHNTVIICGRREAALNEASNKLSGLITRQCDVTVETDREELFAWIAKEHSDLNVLVNNAGIQHWMSVSDTNFYARAKEEIMTNIEAPLHLTSLFLNLPELDTIMNVTSGLSFVPAIKIPVYSATKAFFHSFTLSSRALLASRNIEVIEIVPPALNTDLGGKGIHDAFPPVSDFIDAIFAQLKEGKTQLTFGTSEALSKAGQEVLQPVFAQLNHAN